MLCVVNLLSFSSYACFATDVQVAVETQWSVLCSQARYVCLASLCCSSDVRYLQWDLRKKIISAQFLLDCGLTLSGLCGKVLGPLAACSLSNFMTEADM